jgi:multidrug efflux pump subunit AcrB
MKKIIEYFVKYPVLGNAIMTLIIVFGVFSFMSMKTTFFPDSSVRFLTITASYPGASPEEIEEGIVTKIEDAIKGITGVERTTSTSSENAATILVELEYGADENVVIQDVQSNVNSISSFPVGMEQLNVFKQEPREFVISLAINGNVDLRELKTYARKIERELLAKEGLSKISLSGFPDEEIEVSFNEEKMRAFGITFDQAANSIASANVKVTGGKIKGEKEELLIRADNKKYYAEDLENHIIKTTNNGFVIRLKDIADVNEKWAEDPNRVYYNGKQAVTIEIQKTNQEDLFHITETVRAYIGEFNEKYENVNIDVLRDGSEVIQERIDILSSNGVIGIFLVVLILGLTLNPRLSFWVSISIPLSFLGMFAIATAYGLTINVMSLLGMILVIGILVDDGIVVAENIYSHYEQGETPLKAAVNGTLEVLPSVATGVTTTILIFLIFFFLEGMMGDVATDMAFIVAGTLGFSLIEATIILPAHIAHSKALKGKEVKQNKFLLKFEEVLFSFRDKVYKPILTYCIKHPVVILTIPTALFIITYGALKGNIIQTTFFPSIEFNNVAITLEMPAGTSDNVTDEKLKYIESKILELDVEYAEEYPNRKKFVESISKRTGPGTHVGSVTLVAVGTQEREWDNSIIKAKLREKIGEIEGADKLQVGGGGRFGMPVSIALQSYDLEQLTNAKEELKNELRIIPDLKDVVDDNPPGLREVKLELNDNAFNLGLTTSDVMSQVRSGFFGKEAQRILRGIDEVKIWVRYSEDERSTISKLKDVRIKLADGKQIPLSELADISIDRGVLSIGHIDGQRVIKVEADVTHTGISVTNVTTKLKNDILPELKEKYPDVSWSMEGESRESAKTVDSMMAIVPSFLVLMFMLVVFTFRSFTQSLIVYLLIPFSFIGVLWGHFIQGYLFSVLSGFGAIALIGVVINDSLVFIDAFNRYLRSGLDFTSALTKAGLNRFRPVILTSVTTIFGLAPLIFETSFHAQFLSPMAISMAYGLLVGTALTLVMIPAMLSLVNNIKFKLQKANSREEIEPAIIEQNQLKAYES